MFNAPIIQCSSARRALNSVAIDLPRSPSSLQLPILSAKELIERLLNRGDLNEEEAEAALDFLLQEGSEALISAFLVLLRAKGETFQEVVGLARSMTKCCRKVEGLDDAVDIVGTGGDGANTVNISTGAAILAAACGAKVAKQGNRSSSSACGSADVLEALGVTIELKSEFLWSLKTKLEMAAIVTAPSAAPSYAPEDPTLPKPWKPLVDGTTGFIYFWNPETNDTQYERPAPSSHKSSVFVSSSVQKPSEEGQHYDSNGSLNRGSNHEFSYAKRDQTERSSSDQSGISQESYCCRNEISVTGGDVPAPLTSFEATAFPSEIVREMRQAGFSAPTPIQAQSWPIALQGRDIVAIAKTGSGKTLGYLIPGFIHLKHRRNNSQVGPTILVLSPTRELATQIQAEAVKFGRSSRISCTCLYGGAPKGAQLRELSRGVDIVVATPGRLNDILEMRRISLDQVSYLVLDEADRMLDMGFEPQIRKIVKEVPKLRQTLMYTATWPKGVRKIAADLLVNPVQVNIGNVDELVANKSITQYIEVLMPMEKQRRLEQILRSEESGSKIIIFCSTKKMCDQLSRNLTRNFGAAAIHGDKSQGERDYVLSQFRAGRSPVLVATDVAARGLDVKDIRVVVNYDFPTGIEDYVHRIGRTGRAGATGLAYTFFCDQDAKHALDLVKVLEGANQSVPSELRNLASRGGGGMGRARWGSAPGGRGGGRGGRFNGSSYGGRGGGWVAPSQRGGGYGYDRGSRDSDMAASRKRSRSPNKGSGWSDKRSREY